MVVKKKEHFFSLDTTERRLPPRLTIQVWDNDLFNPDDFIGQCMDSTSACMLSLLVRYWSVFYMVYMYTPPTVHRTHAYVRGSAFVECFCE